MSTVPSGDADVRWLDEDCRALDRHAERTARRRQDRLIKPLGALGRLEGLAIRLAALQGDPLPRVDPARICVFAADHGVAVEGVSAYPQAVTNQMLAGMAAGHAAISVLARALNVPVTIVDCGTATDPGPLPGVISRRVGAGSGNIARGPAMTRTQLAAALAIGREIADKANVQRSRLLICGEMGIANTTAATALSCALLGEPARSLTGPGTGLDDAGVARKTRVIEQALERHHSAGAERDPRPLATLQDLGGFEIAAITGCFIRAAQLGIPALVDGFIATAAALAAERTHPGVVDWLLFSHRSAEPGHTHLLEALSARALLGLDMRLGEGSGAALALPLLRLACTLHAGMATFDEAGVSEA